MGKTEAFKACLLSCFIGVVLSLAVGSAQAQIHQCKEAGRMVYSDKPCPPEAQTLGTRAATNAPNAAFKIEVLTRHYPVSGKTPAAVYQSMQQNGPGGGFSGVARWRVNYAYKTESKKSDCRMADVRVGVVGDILMPQWQEESSAAPAAAQWWRRAYDDLKIHEDGHIQNGREFGLLFKERLLGIGWVPCEGLAALADQEYKLMLKNLGARDAEYDRRTNHGLQQNNPQ